MSQTSPTNDAKPPPDDETRELVLADPDDSKLRHLAVVGDTYTFLVTGEDTAGRYALIDMLVPVDGGPPPHRHGFEEMFHVLEGEIEVTLRGTTTKAGVGQTVNVPANAPHQFHNGFGKPVRLLCMVSPAGLEEYFTHFGDPVASRTSPPPHLDADQQAERMKKAVKYAPRYGIENL